MDYIKGFSLRSLCWAALLVFSSTQAEVSDREGGIQVGAGYLYPDVGLTLQYDDNIFLQNTQEVDSYIVNIAPGIRYEIEGDANLFALDLDVERGLYLSSHDDDYTDLNAVAQATFFPTERLVLGASAGYSEGHRARGSAGSPGAAALTFATPDEYHEWEINGNLQYGVDQVGAPRFLAEAGHIERRYDNNRALTNLDDLDTDWLQATLFYKVMPNTSVLLEGTVTDYDYITSTRDSSKYRVLAGLEWDMTYQTTGLLKVGWSEKDFDNTALSDASGFSWELGVRWRPLSYSEFTLTTSKDFNSASASSGSHSEEKTAAVSWRHDWMSYLHTVADVGYYDTKYGNTATDEETTTFGFRVEYEAMKNLRFSIGVTHAERDSNVANQDYDSNVIKLQMMAEL